MPEHDQLYFIGDDPSIDGIIHIPYKDKPGLQNSAENIYQKILRAFEYMDEMWCWADDYYVSEGYTPDYYYDGLLEDKLIPQTSEDYKLAVRNTIDYLKSNGKPTKNFNVHAPIYYRKDLFPLIEVWKPYGLLIKSIYCNWNGVRGINYPDMKIKKILPYQTLMDMVKNRKFFSSGESYLNRTFINILETLYPQKSKYENQLIYENR